MNKYNKEKLVKETDTSFIYKAVNTETGEYVAIKQLKRKFYGWDEIITLKEIDSLRRINHINVVKLKEVIKLSEHLNLVFELVDCNLTAYYNELKSYQSAIPESTIKQIMKDVTEGLAVTHSYGIVHRNINTHNILVVNKMFKLGDYSSSRYLGNKDESLTEYVYDRNYRAPEVVMGLGYTEKADIFNLACLMIELYNGKALFQASSSDISHIGQLIKFLGTKQFEDWGDAYQWMSSKGIHFPMNKPMNLGNVVPDACHEGLLLLTEMLRVDPVRRISANDMLSHPYFADQLTPHDMNNNVESMNYQMDKGSISDEEFS